MSLLSWWLQELVKVVDRELLHQPGELLEERHLDVRVLRDGERDLEVLAGPAEAVLAPFGEREVRAAPEGERLAERRRLDTQRASQSQRLEVGADAGPEEDVVGDLDDLPG